MKPNLDNARPPYRDEATFTAAIAILRMGSDNEYREPAEARFGHIPTSFEMKQAIERVRRYGVRRPEVCDQKGTG